MFCAGKRRLLADDPMFEDTLHLRLDHSTQDGRDLEAQLRDLFRPDVELFTCGVAGCTAQFRSLRAHKLHYDTSHQHVCQHCHAVFPSTKLVEIHVCEAHDTLFRELARRRPMFKCWVDGCVAVFWSPKERREHCRDAHGRPTSLPDPIYRRSKPSRLPTAAPGRGRKPRFCHFFNTAKGCQRGSACPFVHAPMTDADRAAFRAKKRRQQKERRQRQVGSEEPMRMSGCDVDDSARGQAAPADGCAGDLEEAAMQDDVDAVARQFETLHLPATISFGRRRARTGKLAKEH